MAKNTAGRRFDLDVVQRAFLDLGEAADLRLRELDVASARG